MISDYDLRIAATEAAKALVAAAEALEDCGEQRLPTPEWEQKLRQWDKWWNLRHALRRAAAAALVLLLGCGSWLALDAEAREAFTGWARGVYDTYVTYRDPDHTEQTLLPDENHHYRLGWLPEGYTEVRISERENMVLTTYSNREGNILSFGYAYNGHQSMLLLPDTDQMQHSNIWVGGCMADLWSSQSSETPSSLVWADESNTFYHLSGFLSVDDLIRLAESLEIK